MPTDPIIFLLFVLAVATAGTAVYRRLPVFDPRKHRVLGRPACGAPTCRPRLQKGDQQNPITVEGDSKEGDGPSTR